VAGSGGHWPTNKGTFDKPGLFEKDLVIEVTGQEGRRFRGIRERPELAVAMQVPPHERLGIAYALERATVAALREEGVFASCRPLGRASARPFEDSAMRAFKLYAGKDNASHVLEGTLTLDRCTDVMAVHFEESPPLFHIRTGTMHPQRNTSSRLPVRSNSRPATVETFILHPGDVLGGDRRYRKRPQVAPDRRCAMAALPHRAQAGRGGSLLR
jgi:hypothetical protein